MQDDSGEREADTRRRQAQDKVVEMVKGEESATLQTIEAEAKKRYAAERKEQGVKDTNSTHSGKGLAARVKATLKEEGWVEIGDQMVNMGGVEDGVWRVVKAVLKTMEGKDRELKVASDRIGVLTKRVEELEQGMNKNRQRQNGEKAQPRRDDREEKRNPWQKNKHGKTATAWGRQKSSPNQGRQKKGGERGNTLEKEQGNEQKSEAEQKGEKSRRGDKNQKQSGEGQGGHTKRRRVAPSRTGQKPGVAKDPRIGVPFIIMRGWRNIPTDRRGKESQGKQRQIWHKQGQEGRRSGQGNSAKDRTGGNVKGGQAPKIPVRVEEGETRRA